MVGPRSRPLAPAPLVAARPIAATRTVATMRARMPQPYTTGRPARLVAAGIGANPPGVPTDAVARQYAAAAALRSRDRAARTNVATDCAEGRPDLVATIAARSADGAEDRIAGAGP